MMKTQQIGYRENILPHNKGYKDKPTANIILNGERVEGFPLRSGTRLGFLLSTVLLEVPRQSNQARQRKGIATRKEEVKLSLQML